MRQFNNQSFSKTGLMNIEAPDLSELTSPAPAKINVGFCHSHACTGGDFIGRPTVLPGDRRDRCPKCRSENVFWKQMTKSHLEATVDKWKAFDKARIIKQEENHIDRILDDGRSLAEMKWHEVSTFMSPSRAGDPWIGSCKLCKSYFVRAFTDGKGEIKESDDQAKCKGWFNAMREGDRRIIWRNGLFEIDEIVSVQSSEARFTTIEEKFETEILAKKFLSMKGFKKLSRTESGFRKYVYLLKMEELGENKR